MGNHGIIKLLFESPSGFAIFSFDGTYLEKENAVEHIWSNFVADFMAHNVVWLKEFQKFEDKRAAINTDTGLDQRITEMLKRWCPAGEKLAVGCVEYKAVIESAIPGITCLCDDAVMDVTWGLNNLMHVFLPEETESSKEDLPMCKGLELLLRRNNFHVSKKMVNDHIVETACFLYDCDLRERVNSECLHTFDELLMELSGINAKDWDSMKLATALMMICYPKEKIEYPAEKFTESQLQKILNPAPEYEDGIIKSTISGVYEELLYVREVKDTKLRLMQSLVQEGKEALERASESSVQAGSGIQDATRKEFACRLAVETSS